MIKRDIVIVGQQPWDIEIGSNCKNIAIELSKFNRILYVNPPLDRVTVWKHFKDSKIKKRVELIKAKSIGLVKIKHNLWNMYPDAIIESINWVPDGCLYTTLNKVNNKRFATSISRAIADLAFKNIILFNDNDIIRSFYLQDFLFPSLSIYYSRDYMLGVDYWKKHGKKLEPKLIAKSTMCVANSVYLTDYCKKYNKRSYYVGQGCDFNDFINISPEIPTDLKNIRYPIVGYIGALQASRLDINLLAKVALEKPDWNIVLIGPEDESFKRCKLHGISNIHFLGFKATTYLAIYINAFDVCINPQILNAITIGNYPRKIDEYLILGKPVVATKTLAMSVFEEYVYLANGANEYVELIEFALQEDSKLLQNKRISFASLHTWENSVNEIYKSIGLTPNT